MSLKKEDFNQATLGGLTVAEEAMEQIRAAIPKIVVQCPFCFVHSELANWVQFNERGERLAKLKCSNCKKGLTSETAQITKSAKGFGKWVADYKFFWGKAVDHDKYPADFKEAFPKEYQEEFWQSYKENKPGFEERLKERQTEPEYKVMY